MDYRIAVFHLVISLETTVQKQSTSKYRFVYDHNVCVLFDMHIAFVMIFLTIALCSSYCSCTFRIY